MEKNNEISEIERIKLQLEQKLLEIEKRKKANSSIKEVVTSKNEEKSLFELRKELQELQKNKNLKVVKPKEHKSEVNQFKSPIKTHISSISEKTKQTEISKKIVANPTKPVTSVSDIDSSKKENIKVVITKDNKSAKIDNKTKQTDSVKEKSAVTTNKASISKQKPKESTIARNKIIFIIAFTFAVLYLGYLYKLKIDLNKEKEALELKKQEQIDYSKGDAIFKEVEEETPDEELQDIK